MLQTSNKKRIHFYMKFYRYFITIFSIFIFLPFSYLYAALTCSITDAVSCTDTVMLRISDTPTSETHGQNAHAELPSESTAAYDNYVVCCSGVTGLSNSCSESNKAIFARLSGVTNAHVEENTENNANYSQNACIASTYAGDIITVGYQATNCTGYDTTLFSMSDTSTNSMVGIPTAYTNKVCAKIFSQAVSFNISDTSVGFGYLTSAGLRYATNDGQGSDNPVEAYSLEASTNAPSGYTIFVQGNSLSNGLATITAIGGTPETPTAGENKFGMKASATGSGGGEVVYPYNDATDFAYGATSSTPSNMALANSGNGESTSYGITTVATIDSVLNYGEYSTSLTYILVPNY